VADRTTKVTLIAEVNGYVSGMERARQSTSNMASDSQQKLAQQSQAFQSLGVAAVAVGVVAAAAVGLAVRSFSNFDAKLSEIKAATNETTENIDLLGAAAIEAGRVTAFGAGEAADAITELAKAGVSTADILGGALSGALDLAAAGQIDVARAAEISATAMTQFGIAGSKVPHIADLLSAGANKAQGGVEELSQALNQAGLVSAAAGLSLEETVGGLAAFASAGLLGSDAGTSFKSMLQRLTPVSAESKREMDRLGISAFDAQGEFIGLEAFAGNLRESMVKLTPEQRAASQAIIFGTDAVRASNILYEQGAPGIAAWIAGVDDSGNAARTAALKLDNLNGDLRILQGSFETALIQAGSGANEVLREMVQTATFLVNSFGDLPTPVLDAGLAIGTVAAAVLLVGGGALIAVPKVTAFKLSLDALNVSGKAVSVTLGAATVALAVVTLAVGAVFQAMADRAQTVDSFTNSLDTLTGATTKYTRELVQQQLESGDAGKIGDMLGLTTKELTDLTMDGTDAISAFVKEQQDSNSTNSEARLLYQGLGVELDTVAGQLQKAEDSAKENRRATLAATEATDENVEALATLQGQAAASTDEIDALAAAIRGFGSTTLNVRDAQRQFESAIDDATAAVVENGVTLDRGTEAGRANEASLDAIASSALEAAASIFEKTKSEEDATVAVEAGRAALILQLAQYGIVGEAAELYADNLGLIPENVSTSVTLTGAETVEAALSQLFRNRGAIIARGSTGVGNNNNLRARENGGLEEYENGGMREGIYRGRPGGIIKFAEENTRWEAFISGKPGQEARNRRILLDAGQRLGMLVPASAPMGGQMGQMPGSVDQRTVVTVNGNVGFDPAQLAAELAVQKRKSIALSNIRGVGVA